MWLCSPAEVHQYFRAPALRLEALRSSQMLVNFYYTTWHHIPKNSTLHIHCSENPKHKIPSQNLDIQKPSVFSFNTVLLKFLPPKKASKMTPNSKILCILYNSLNGQFKTHMWCNGLTSYIVQWFATKIY